jgi:hypothetical protein
LNPAIFYGGVGHVQEMKGTSFHLSGSRLRWKLLKTTPAEGKYAIASLAPTTATQDLSYRIPPEVLGSVLMHTIDPAEFVHPKRRDRKYIIGSRTFKLIP